MSVSLNTFQDSYARSFPAEVPMKAAQGFIVTAAISLIAGNAANFALLGGAIAATATLIEAIARPFIQAVFPDNPLIGSAISIVVPNMIALGLAASLVPWIGISYKVTSSVLSLLAWLVLNQQFYHRNVGMVNVL
jgi:hypothetical protein